jgi:hypothetical protein
MDGYTEDADIWAPSPSASYRRDATICAYVLIGDVSAFWK